MVKFPKKTARKFFRKSTYASTRKMVTRPQLRRAITDVNKLKKVARKVEIKEFIVTVSTQSSGGATGMTVAGSNTAIGWMPTVNPPLGDESGSR